jgi:hypothetical protein
MDQGHVRSTKRALRQKRRELPIDPDLSANFSTEELNTALLVVKSGKAAGFDGAYPEFIKNSGSRTKEWIVALFNDILKSWKRWFWSFALSANFTAQYRFQDT